MNNRSTWVDTWVDFGGQHIAHFENDETYFVHSGRLGTAGIVTDYSGAVIQDELHYPWGRVWTTMGAQTEERFASLNHRDSATNLDPTHFRMYSSDEGRWLTPDPAQADIYNPQSMSRYAYADANPMNLVDLLGLGPAVPCMKYGEPMICTTVTAPDSFTLSPTQSAIFGQVYQQASFLESGSFYGEWYGGSTFAAYLLSPGLITTTGQTIGAAMETYVPGSVEAATQFVSGAVTAAPQTTWAAVGAAVAGYGDEVVTYGEDVFGWIEHELC